MRPMLVAQYPELACPCGATVTVECGWCGVGLRTHVEELAASGPQREVFCPRCAVIAAQTRGFSVGAPAMRALLELAAATRASRN